jgi:toxin YhaV
VRTVKGWATLAHPLFLEAFGALIDAVAAERALKPLEYKSGANAKLLAAVLHLVDETIPSDPTSPAFRQGKTLGPEYSHWFRAKFGSGRFRLFFRYMAKPPVIIYAWLNNEDTLRTRGSKTDAYRVFRGMLDGGNPPDDWPALKAACGTKDGLGQAVARAGDALVPVDESPEPSAPPSA